METKITPGYYIDGNIVELLYKTKTLRFFIKTPYRETIYVVNPKNVVIAAIHGVAKEGVADLYLTTTNGKRYE